MNVVLPELDGRLLTRAISFKARCRPIRGWSSAACATRPLADRVDYVARLAAAWARLGRTPRDERDASRWCCRTIPRAAAAPAMPSGSTAPASVAEILRLLRRRLRPAHGRRRRTSSACSTRADDRYVYRPARGLPESCNELRGWGDRHDRLVASFDCLLAAARSSCCCSPTAASADDRKAAYHDMSLPADATPMSRCIRGCATTEKIDALIHLGTHGTLEWLPGKALALSAECWPEAVLGPVPVIYPFIVNNPGEAVQAKRRLARRHHRPSHAAAQRRGAARADGRHGSAWSRNMPRPTVSTAVACVFLEDEIVERAWTSGLAGGMRPR